MLDGAGPAGTLVAVPELPEVEALARHLRAHAVGRTVHRVDLASLAVLKTATPPSRLHGRQVIDARRHGKFLDLDTGGLHLVSHLARAGWLRWAQTLAAAPPKPGKGPLALRVHLGRIAEPAGDAGPGFDLTEAGTKKALAVWVVTDPAQVPAIAGLGPDASGLDADALREVLAGRSERLKTALTSQPVIAGLGNAYSDEILHAARLSPYATAGGLSEEATERLAEAMHAVLAEALARSVAVEPAALKGEKRSGLRVHGRTGLPCPECGDTVREVSFAEKSFQYCPGCQTSGRVLADRRLSRLVK
jgi:formamidopyrimidine-DNA glycosylase